MKDIWSYAIERARAARPDVDDQERPAGRVLRVKGGYNPNSSSLGIAVVFVMMGPFFGYLAVTLVSSIIRLRGKSGAEDAEQE